MSHLRIGAAALVAAVAVLGSAPIVAAATHRTECGQVVAYTAPDPSGPTAGLLTVGFLPSWTIAPDATVSAPATTLLPGLINNVSCLGFDLDGSGHITALDLATHGVISGMAVYDSGMDAYVLADRLALPTSVLTFIPGLGVVFTTSAQAARPATLTVDADPTLGTISAFDGRVSTCGKAHVTSGGDAVIGQATIPAAFIDPGDVAQIHGAGARQVCAAIRSLGVVSTSGPPTIQVAVVLSVGAGGPTVTAPPTSTEAASAMPLAATGDDVREVVALLGVFLLALVAAARRRLRSVAAASDWPR